MSSPYPILDNRPIDQWKVTELKEELKKRKLTTKGLKDDLIKRLDEAIRIESANADNGLNGDPQPVVGVKVVEPRSGSRTPKSIGSGGRKRTEKVDVPVQIDNRAATLDQGNIQEGYILVDKDACAIVEEGLGQSTTVETTVETSVTVTESVVTEEAVVVQDSQYTEASKGNWNSKPLLENEDAKPLLENEDPKPRLENEDPKPQLENEDPKPQLENEEPEPQLEDPKPQLEDPKPQLENVDLKPQLENEALKPQLEIEDLKPQLENEGLEPTAKDDMLGSSASNYQVSEVSTLGSEVKYDSISTDSVSINETIELKDNIIADHVKLELDIVKPEMVDPSSSTVVPVSGDSHPMDVDEPLEDKASLGEKDDNITNADISKKNDNADLGYSEILNLERSSGDDSMEEDVLDSKQIDSKYSSDDVGDIGEKNEVPIVNEESRAGIVGDDIATDKNDVSVENKNHPALPAEKRKLNDQAAVGSNEPVKRRRWNSENLKVPELQSPLQTPSVTPKDTFQSPSLKRSFSRSNSTMSEDAPKERVVPPSQKPPTNSLRIDRFLRPFTLKAVQELLGKTGKVTDFWMDHIKTHCYVTYSSTEEALETRNAVYNLQWPPNGGRLLVAEFVDPQEVQTRVQIPQTPATPISSGPAVPVAPSTSQPQPSPRQPRQQLPPPPSLPPPPPLTAPSSARERLPLPPPPPLPEKLDTPIVTLDDLFRKTKSTPRIYYLPLSEEQVAEKLAAQGKNAKQ
ncbi:apoptotic chromatin condensation inducer in the nucleus [Prunus avium]|uniref:Apoptotic chromatin condensation inducer in the nucleus n=1 Tax=Prunus avium TaxID=42229 RepID=A0A6P5U3D7_PRUAV|nr:apoptotic chromatin condensation inducer in the nucleus [Prunus avium]